MVGERFDRIARAWGAGSRRRVLAGLAAAALATVSPGRASAACTLATCGATFPCGERACGPVMCETTISPAGELCREAEGECELDGFCTGASLACPARSRPNGTACSDDGNPCTAAVCHDGVCVHPAMADGTPCPGGACCGGQCVDTRTDVDRCGGCAIVCDAGQCCGGRCVDPQSNRQHCGQCGKRCRKGNCRNGRCKKRRKR